MTTPLTNEFETQIALAKVQCIETVMTQAGAYTTDENALYTLQDAVNHNFTEDELEQLHNRIQAYLAGNGAQRSGLIGIILSQNDSVNMKRLLTATRQENKVDAEERDPIDTAYFLIVRDLTLLAWESLKEELPDIRCLPLVEPSGVPDSNPA